MREILPISGVYMFISRAAIVDFPSPEEPTTNVISLAGKKREMSLMVGSERVGYVKVTLWRETSL